MGQKEDSWNEYQPLVLHELQRLASAIELMAKEQHAQSLAIETIKLKSGFVATISGFIAAIGFTLGKHFFDR